MMRTMTDLQAPATVWGQELRNYETQKRRVVDEGFVRNETVRVTAGHTKLQERTFDPLLQRYRDNGLEASQRTLEEKERVSHLNRAYDVQNLREQPFHIITHVNKLEALAPGEDAGRLGGKPRNKERGKGNFPDTAVDFNIVSNLPHDVHHWGREGVRPGVKERSPRHRLVPAFLVKDFDIINNRYHDDHDLRVSRDKHLRLLDGAKKYAERNRYDPINQQFTDPREEEHARTADDAREVEIVLRAQHQIPPSYKGRMSQHYDVVTHEVHDKDRVRNWDRMEDARKERYRNKYIFEHNLHARDVKGDHMIEARKLNKVAGERYNEDALRGYDIVTNQKYGHRSHKDKVLHEPFTKLRPGAWDRSQMGERDRSMSQPAAEFRTAPTLGVLNKPPASPAAGPAPSDAGRKPLSASSSAPQLRREPRDAPKPGSATMPFDAVRTMTPADAKAAAMFTPQPAASGRMPTGASYCSSAPGRHPPEAPGLTRPPPRAPEAIPGSPKGSVYSRPSRQA